MIPLSGPLPVEARLFRYDVPLLAPVRIGTTVLGRREGLLLRLRGADGTEGLGEIAPLPGLSCESLDEAEAEVRRLLPHVRQGIPAESLLPSVAFGLSTAIGALEAARSGVLLPLVWTTHPAREVALNALLWGSPQEMMAQAKTAAAAGYRMAKIKVGRADVDTDLALVRRLSETLGPGVRLRLDANRAWTLPDALRFAGGIAGLPVDYVEEPLRQADDLARLVRETNLPVALDETVSSLPPGGLAHFGFVRAVVLKPMLLGAASRVLHLAGEAQAMGAEPVISASFETGIGLRTLVALAAATGAGQPTAGLDTYRFMAADVIRPRPALDRPTVHVAQLLESAVQIDTEAVHDITG